MNRVKLRSIIKRLLPLGCMLLLGGSVVVAQDAGSAAFGPVDLTVQVDRKVCSNPVGPGYPVCEPAGQPAGPTNRHPVLLGIQVLDFGEPVLGLTQTAFSIYNPLVPAQGGFLKIKDCDIHCFSEWGHGTYMLYVDPIPADPYTWKSGAYFVQVRVTFTRAWRTVTRRAFARIDIP